MTDRRAMFRPAKQLVHPGPIAVVDGQACDLLDRLLSLDKVYRQVRGQCEQLDNAITAIRLAGAAYRERSAVGPHSAPRPDIAPHSTRQQNTTLSTTQAAAILGIEPRSVRRAALEKRLPATCLDGRYRFNPDDLANYQGAP